MNKKETIILEAFAKPLLLKRFLKEQKPIKLRRRLSMTRHQESYNEMKWRFKIINNLYNLCQCQ